MEHLQAQHRSALRFHADEQNTNRSKLTDRSRNKSSSSENSNDDVNQRIKSTNMLMMKKIHREMTGKTNL